jgi:ABC-type uncharacterized transport system substrate-binding protein
MVRDALSPPLAQPRSGEVRSGVMLSRRRFLGSLGLLATPLVVEAQQARRVQTIGYLSSLSFSPSTSLGWREAFEQALQDLGWIKGQNFVIEYRSAEGQLERLPRLAIELVSLKVDLIFAPSALETDAAKRATGSIPIVFAIHGDPLGSGHVKSLARPGGNVTGFSQVHPDLIPKQLDLLKQVLPRISRVAVVWNPANPAKAGEWREVQPVARALGVTLESHEIRGLTDLDTVSAAIRHRRPDAILILGDRSGSTSSRCRASRSRCSPETL